jgi:drug/metabolite transporter (DMT)-like permease
MSTIAVKKAYAAGSEPSSLLVARFAIAGTLFALTAASSLRSALPVPLRSVGLCGLAGLALVGSVRGELEGLARLQAAVLVVLLYISPVWVAVFESVLGRRLIDRRSATAMTLVLLGIILMAGPWTGSTWNAAGVAAGLLASALIAVFLVLMARALTDLPPVVGVSIAMTTGALVAVVSQPTALPHELGGKASTPYVVAVGVLIWIWGLLLAVGLSRTDALTSAIVSSIEPVFVALLGVALLSEAPSALQIVGGVVVITGVLVVSTPNKSAITGRPRDAD